jgi:hypothetical protein
MIHKNSLWALLCAAGLQLMPQCGNAGPQQREKPADKPPAATNEAQIAGARKQLFASREALLQTPPVPISQKDILVSGERALKFTAAAWDENKEHRIVNLSLDGHSDWKQLGNKGLIVLACLAATNEPGIATRALNIIAVETKLDFTSFTGVGTIMPMTDYGAENIGYAMLGSDRLYPVEYKTGAKLQAAILLDWAIMAPPLTLEKDKRVRLLLPRSSSGVLGQGGFSGSGRIAFLLIGTTSEKGKDEPISNVIELPVTF